jgi:hypothetical protein
MDQNEEIQKKNKRKKKIDIDTLNIIRPDRMSENLHSISICREKYREGGSKKIK